MRPIEKKYKTLPEIASELGISQRRIRYFEADNPDFKINKIRGRGYYSEEDIGRLKKYFAGEKDYVLWAIERLISKFSSIKNAIDGLTEP